MTESSELEHLYPEIATAGSLAAALMAVATEHNLALGEVEANSWAGWALVPSETTERRGLAVRAANNERRLSIDGWGLGICLIAGDTDDLIQVVRAAHGWRTGMPLQDIRRSVPFVRLTGFGEVVEQGPAQVVTAQWEALRQNAEQRSTNHRALVEAAHREPKFRMLYPYTSHEVLNFSITTGYPFGRVPVCLTATGVHTDYRVYGPDGVLIETDSVQEAVSLAVAHLPADLGPARAGTSGE